MRLTLAIGRNMRQATKDRFDLDPLDLDRESFPSIGDLTIGVLAEFFPLELNRPVEIVAKVIAPEDHGVIADIPIRFANRPAPSLHCIAPAAVEVPELPLPCPGTYTVQLWHGQKMLCELTHDVYHKPSSK
jgi:hypothetical protein